MLNDELENIGFINQDFDFLLPDQNCSSVTDRMKDIIFSLDIYDFYIPPDGYSESESEGCFVYIGQSTDEHFHLSIRFLYNYDVTFDYLENKIELRPKPGAPSGNRIIEHRDDW